MDNRVGVVTGASSGFGRESFRRLAQDPDINWTLYAIGRQADSLEALTGEVGGEVMLCDLSDPEQIRATTAEILGRHPSIHLLLNSAGEALRDQRFVDAEPGTMALRRVMDVNHHGTVEFTQGLLPGLRQAAQSPSHGHADIITIVSAAADIANPHAGAYGASKAAQGLYSRSLTADLRPDGISVHAIHPGKADTPGHPQDFNRSKSLVSRLMSRATGTDIDTVAGAVVRRIDKPSGEVYLPHILHGVAVVEAVAPKTVTRVVNALFS